VTIDQAKSAGYAIRRAAAQCPALNNRIVAAGALDSGEGSVQRQGAGPGSKTPMIILHFCRSSQ
jgi:hypothetical protein